MDVNSDRGAQLRIRDIRLIANHTDIQTGCAPMGQEEVRDQDGQCGEVVGVVLGKANVPVMANYRRW